MWAKHKQPGFTIVELLIVIVVIGILAAITIVAYNGVQARGRDSVRKADLVSINRAIKLFYADNGNYPMTSGWCTQISHPSYAAAFKAEVAPYISKIPYDPLYSATNQDYFYKNIDDQSYELYAELEQSDENSYASGGCISIGGISNLYDYRVQ